MQSSTVALPLRLDEAARVEVERRFETAFQVHRAVLREALRRMDLCCESRDWQTATALPAGSVRSELYRSVTDRYGFNEYGLIKYAGRVRCGAPQLMEHLGNVEAQALAKRAWQAVRRHVYGDTAGKELRRPHLPRLDEFTCISSDCSHRQGILLRGSYQAGAHVKGRPVQRKKRSDSSTVVDVPLYFQWGVGLGHRTKLVVAVHAAHSGIQAARRAYYLSDLTKVVDVQLVRTTVRGKWQYSLHARVAKAPYRPDDRYATTSDGKVGVDLGPQRLALVTGAPPRSSSCTPRRMRTEPRSMPPSVDCAVSSEPRSGPRSGPDERTTRTPTTGRAGRGAPGSVASSRSASRSTPVPGSSPLGVLWARSSLRWRSPTSSPTATRSSRGSEPSRSPACWAPRRVVEGPQPASSVVSTIVYPMLRGPAGRTASASSCRSGKGSVSLSSFDAQPTSKRSELAHLLLPPGAMLWLLAQYGAHPLTVLCPWSPQHVPHSP